MTARLYAHLSDEAIYVQFDDTASNVSQIFTLPELAKNLINSQMMVSEEQRLEAVKAFKSAKESMEKAINILDQAINEYSEQFVFVDGNVATLVSNKVPSSELANIKAILKSRGFEVIEKQALTELPK